MGNSCCHAESPCSSAEERSGLLKNDSKVSIPVSETIVVSTCGPGGDDDIRKTPEEANVPVEGNAEDVQVKRSPENGEVEPRNTQGNGLLEKESTQTSAPSPARHAEENSTKVSVGDAKEPPADLLHRTSNSLQRENHTWEVFPATNAETSEETPASEEERIQDSVSQAAEAKNRPDGEVNRALDPSHSEDERAKVSADPPVQQKVFSVPDAPLSSAEHEVACQEISSPSSRVSAPVPDNEPPSVLKDADLDSSGCESTGLNRSGEEREPTDALREPETAAPADASESQVSTPEEKTSPAGSDVTSLSTSAAQDAEEKFSWDVHNKVGDVPEAEDSGETENSPRAAVSQAGDVVDVQESAGGDLQASEGSSSEVREREDAAQDGLGNSEEDLYRAAEELPASQSSEPGPRSVFETTLTKLEDRCSLAPAVDILSYSEREWRGNTAKSALIRKGYREMSLRFGSVRRVRGDNYCALRATLFQVLSHSTQLPAWLQEEDVTMLPKHLEAQQGLTTHWTFPRECFQGDGTGDAVQQLQGYMELLQNKWRAAVDCSSAAERQRLCERVFQGGEEELGLLEALKLLMLGRAVELHGLMAAGGDVPLFCWLLFARDSSDCPRSFLCNHLRHVGLSAGLEQVEMFLLGDALHCTIQVYRLYKADTEEFVTYYPDDHKDDWPCVCLVTEDDRHYNVPVVEAAGVPRELLSS